MTSTSRNTVSPAVHTVGGLLPVDMLKRIADGRDKEVKGVESADYHIAVKRTSVQDEAERHWAYLKGVWQALREQLPDRTTPDATGIATEQWLMPLFNALGFGRPVRIGASGLASDDAARVFQISHRWEHVPIHVVSWTAELDKRLDGIAGPDGAAPQSLMQELLNRSSAHLWGLLSNGRVLRLLRDSTSLVGSSYVEFDLEAIFDGELFSDFVLLYRLLHVSRFETRGESESPSSCWLETWRATAITDGMRALEQLRDGVKSAIEALGTGFLEHPANAELREALNIQKFHHSLLRLVYRLLFLFVAEDRDVLIPPDADPMARDRYEKYFASARLRRAARRIRGTAHSDQWEALKLVLRGVGQEGGRPELGLPALGGIFEDIEVDRPVMGSRLANTRLLEAIRALSLVRDKAAKRNRVVDYRHLGAEELGSVYESLLESVPRHDPGSRRFTLEDLAGNERKKTGSYYTPSSLIEVLLETALDPVLDDAEKRGNTTGDVEGELLKVTVCDPACGSGHFLVAAARRIAKRLAAVREQNPEPTIEATRHALREVVARNIYGVDLNDMAVELAKVSLWLEALEPGKPLGFLDAHIKRGNSLLGVTPKLLADGIPDDAFKPIEGDDKAFATKLKKRNALERSGLESLFDLDNGPKVTNIAFARGVRSITEAPADTLHDVHLQSSKFRALEQSPEYLRARNVADAWCAAFVWKKTPDAPEPITQGKLRDLENIETVGISKATQDEIVRLARDEYHFFHWHLEFPEVFPVGNGGDPDPRTGWAGGFSCVLGNPPWERLRHQEEEFFATRNPDIASAANAAQRKRMIAALEATHPELLGDFLQGKRRMEGESAFLRFSDRFPLTSHGEINSYALFAEIDRDLVGPTGRLGIIVPTGIATDATTQYFFRGLIENASLSSLYDFENRKPLFEDVDSRFKFCTLTLAGRDVREPEASFAFFIHDPSELDQTDKRFSLTPEEIKLLNPNTGTLPVFRSRRDAEITLSIYRRVPVLLKQGDTDGNPWDLTFLRMFDMAKESHLFHTGEELERKGWKLDGNVFASGDNRMLPLYEAKMLHQFDHRWATYKSGGSTRDLQIAEKQDPNFAALPRYWVTKPEVEAKFAAKGWDRGWLLGFRDICRSTDVRTSIFEAMPAAAVGHTNPIVLSSAIAAMPRLYANLTSFAFDFVTRQKVGGTHLTFTYLYQLPAFPPHPSLYLGKVAIDSWLTLRVLELTYTAYDMEPFARDLGDTGAPFRWDEERRFKLRAELDAAFFHLYGIERDDVDYIMETFPIVKREDEAKYGSFRTKELILEIYDAMAVAIATDAAYQTILDPQPGEGPRHPAKPKSE